MADQPHSPVPPPPQPSPAPAPQAAPPPDPWQPPPDRRAPRWRAVPGWIAAVGAATAVASVAAFVTVLLWPAGDAGEGDAPLEFTGFTYVDRVEFGEQTRTTLTAVRGDRAYVAWEQAGDLAVVASDLPGAAEVWRTGVSGARQWGRLVPATTVVLVFGQELLDDEPRPLVVLDAADGRELWRRDVRGEDRYAIAGDTLLWLDRDGAALRGLDLAAGTERWSRPFPAAEPPATIRVHTDADLAATTGGSGQLGVELTDPRLVLVADDRSARVIDVSDGRTISEGTNIADPDDQLLAYGDRLFVAPDEPGYQLHSYDLAQLSAVPRSHYTAPGTGRRPQALDPCGQGRVCLLERESFDRETTEVVAVDGVDGGVLWRQPVPEAEGLLPVGPWVVVATRVEFAPGVVAFDAAGERVLDRDGTAVRLDAVNLLLFSIDLGSIGQDVVPADGVALGAEPVELGSVRDVRGEFCSWNETHLVCPDQEGASIWRFADG